MFWFVLFLVGTYPSEPCCRCVMYLPMLFAATSPGMAREREGYLLGAVQDEGLAAALVEEFLGEVRRTVGLASS